MVRNQCKWTTVPESESDAGAEAEAALGQFHRPCRKAAPVAADDMTRYLFYNYCRCC